MATYSDIKRTDYTQRYGTIRRMWMAISRPAELMRDISREEGKWFGVVLLLPSAISLIFAVVRARLLNGELLANAMTIVEGGEMTEDEISQYIAQVQVSGFMAEPVMPLLVSLIAAVFLLFFVKQVGGKCTMKHCLSAVAYASVPLSISKIVVFIASYITGTFKVNTSLTLISNLFAPDIAGTYLYGFLRAVNPLTAWFFALLAVALAEFSGKSKAFAYIFTAAVYLLGCSISAFMLMQ